MEAVGNLFPFHSLSLPLKSIGTIPRVEQQASGPEAAGLLSGHPLQCISSLETTEQLSPAQAGSSREPGVRKCEVCVHIHISVCVGQRSTSDIIPQALCTLILESGSLTRICSTLQASLTLPGALGI